MKFIIDIPDQVIDEEPELHHYLAALQLTANRTATSQSGVKQ